MNHDPRNPKLPTKTNKLRTLWALSALTLTFALAEGCSQRAFVEEAALAAPLNSERIRQQFGSYGIEVLQQDEALRVSNLYSTEAGQRICRTLAIVKTAAPIPTELAKAHAEIVAGGSIGAVLSRNGWQVDKRRLEIAPMKVAVESRAATLMQLSAPAALAIELYELLVQRDELSLAYAVIAEIHHPDYLTLDQLSGQRQLQRDQRKASNMLSLAKRIAGEPIKH